MAALRSKTPGADILPTGSSNLNLRGYSPDQTVVLINGRRLPEVMTSDARTLGTDVNFIPLSLVQQIEVLPVSASALYTGNAVGGVINIVLRSGADADTTELTTTYTNALRGFDAPQSSVLAAARPDPARRKAAPAGERQSHAVGPSRGNPSWITSGPASSLPYRWRIPFIAPRRISAVRIKPRFSGPVRQR